MEAMGPWSCRPSEPMVPEPMVPWSEMSGRMISGDQLSLVGRMPGCQTRKGLLEKRINQCPNGGETADVNDVAEEKLKRRALPMLSRFNMTPAVSLSASLEWAMKHCNWPRIQATCCPWHATVKAATHELLQKLHCPCNPSWMPLQEWQCSHCSCMNLAETSTCDMCCQESGYVPFASGVDNHKRAWRALVVSSLEHHNAPSACNSTNVTPSRSSPANSSNASLERGANASCVGNGRSLAWPVNPSNTSLALSLEWTLKHWNMPLMPDSCCPFHSMIRVALAVMRHHAASACEPEWKTLSGWQCASCRCWNHWSVTRCDMCSECVDSTLDSLQFTWLKL